MPRKFKPAIGGCRLHCHQPQINDFGFYGVKGPSGEVGYGLLVGGGLSSTPHFGQPMRVFVKPEQVVEVSRAIATVFRDHGYREKRTRARLKFLVADKGWQWTRDRIEEVLGYQLEHDDTLLHPPAIHSDHLGIGSRRTATTTSACRSAGDAGPHATWRTSPISRTVMPSAKTHTHDRQAERYPPGHPRGQPRGRRKGTDQPGLAARRPLAPHEPDLLHRQRILQPRRRRDQAPRGSRAAMA
ncbi:MAG: hypothetical protein R3C45_16530 [Phycisphaerales bacterium]